MTPVDYRLLENRYAGFVAYHVAGMRMDEVDPAKPVLQRLVKELRMSIDQRLWLAWLYGSCYCVATAFYIFTQFPTLNAALAVDIDAWWKEHRAKVLFESDRRWVRSRNQFPDMVRSYAAFCRGGQYAAFMRLMKDSPQKSYDAIYAACGKGLYQFGRFSLFTYLEALYNVTCFPITPTGLDLREALSCLNGLCYLLGKDSWVHHAAHAEKLTYKQYEWLQAKLAELYAYLLRKHPDIPTTYWNLETSLCAYKKLFFCTRYVGYYIDRQMVEIQKLQAAAPDEADWNLLWRIRREHFNPRALGEISGWNGIRHERLRYFMDTGNLAPEGDMPSRCYA